MLKTPYCIANFWLRVLVKGEWHQKFSVQCLYILTSSVLCTLYSLLRGQGSDASLVCWHCIITNWCTGSSQLLYIIYCLPNCLLYMEFSESCIIWWICLPTNNSVSSVACIAVYVQLYKYFIVFCSYYLIKIKMLVLVIRGVGLVNLIRLR
jgi:hypothetical protein